MDSEYCNWDRAFDENWYHLLTYKGKPFDTSIIKDLEDFIPIEKVEPEDFGYFKEHSLGVSDQYPDILLEEVVGCETGCILYFHGDKMIEEIKDIRKRFEKRQYLKVRNPIFSHELRTLD